MKENVSYIYMEYYQTLKMSEILSFYGNMNGTGWRTLTGIRDTQFCLFSSKKSIPWKSKKCDHRA